MNKKRVPFSRTKDFVNIPNLLHHQIKSYNEFINIHIKEILEQVFPIYDRESDPSFELNCEGYDVEPPEITTKESKDKGLTYAGHLYLNLTLKNNIMGGKEQNSRVFFGEIPYMTETGSFIMNGNERVIVSQIVKSPGVYFESTINEKGVPLYGAVIQPDRGSWLRFETDARNEAWVKIDQNKKILLTTFLKIIGFKNNDEIKKTFGENNHFILATLKKDETETEEEAIMEVYKRLRPGEPQIFEKAKKLFQYMFQDPKRYDLEEVGRFKLNQKLKFRQRAIKKKLAEDIGEFKKGYEINDELLKVIEQDDLLIETKDKKNVQLYRNKKTDDRVLQEQDIIAVVNYMLNLDNDVGVIDNIDHLSNRYLRMVGKSLQKEFLIGMRRVEENIKKKLIIGASGYKKDDDELTPEKLAFVRPMEAKFKEFLGSSQLSQYVDQINPLGEISNKRRLTAIGPGGFSKERAGVEVRDVNYTHYGRICPIETPEGASVGLISQMSLFSDINKYGFLVTPYRQVKNGTPSNETVKLTADDEEHYYIADVASLNQDGEFSKDEVLVKYGEEYLTVDKERVDFIGISSKQPFGVGACCIPFLENDDAARVLMGANMQRQGVPTLIPEEPIIGTGLEKIIARDTNSSIYAKEDGVVEEILDDRILVKEKKDRIRTYEINKFTRTNDSTCWSHFVKCFVGKKIKKGEILADSTNSNNGELAVGQNVTIAFLPMEGYNYEDSIVVSDRLTKDDKFSTVMIEEYKIDVRKTRMGPEEITREIPNVGEKQKSNLDEEGIVEIGSYVKGGDILIGKRTPRLKEDKTPEDRLIESLYVGKTNDFRDNSLKVEFGEEEKIVIDVIRNKNRDSDYKKGVIEEIKVYVAEKRKISPGDKMAGRHGNKGVVSVVLPEEDMPHLEDGTPVDVVLNPLGVPSRMNIGQVMEVHLGMVAKTLGVKFEVPVFSGMNSKDEIQNLFLENNLPEDGKFTMYDGKTGEKFENKITVGVMYMMKLNHQISDKIHARSTGPYSLVTQQPLGGKAQNGGQRFGEMEVWALEGHGAANILQEMLTLKSDDFMGRSKLYKALVKGQNLPEPNLTESLKLLLNEIRSLGIDTDIIVQDNKSLMNPDYKPKKIKLKEDVEELEDEPLFDDIDSDTDEDDNNL